PFENLILIRFKPNQVKLGKALGYEARLSLEFAHVVELQMKKEGIPDVLETQDYSGIGYYILQKKYLLFPLFKELKVVTTIHAPGFLYLDYNQVPLYKFPEYWSGEMEKATIMMSDLVLTPSNYIIKELEGRMNILDKNVTRVFNPLKDQFDSDAPPKYDEGDLVFFGKLTPQKGCLEMLSYLRDMWDNGFDKTISIVGSGDHFFYPVQEDMSVYLGKRYEKYIKKGLIKFEGNLPQSLLVNRIKKAHVVIIPSIVDNLPYAVLEAMSMGKVVLSSKNGGHTEILVHQESGFIFDHQEEGGFEKELTSILAMSASALNSIGEKAKKAVSSATNYNTVYAQKEPILTKLITSDYQTDTFPFIEKIDNETIEKRELDKSVEQKLSVVIPYYNMGDFIEDAVKSLSKSTYKNMEIIVINDGSSEKASIDELTRLEEKYKIKVYHKKNEGLSLTRNFGAKKTTGDILAFLDADDTVSPEYHERAIEILNRYSNVSFVGCWAQYFGESKDIWPTFNPEPPYLLTHNVINSSSLV
ncbi:MAG: glycosyltransferase, partial [Bacteroidetes bacterium]|nr:glycosyltransferase [Bacteroidota bacterium]